MSHEPPPARDTAGTRRPARLLEEMGRAQAILASLALLLLVTSVDLALGHEISFSIFYLLPVGLASWSLGRLGGLLFSTLSAGAWLLADAAAGAVYSHPLIPVWNMLVRFGIFVTVTVTMAALRRSLQALEAAHAEAVQHALEDPLTGLASTRALFEEASRAAAQPGFTRRPLTIVYLDVDDQRGFNAYFGRQKGDLLLASLGRRMRELIQTRGLACRIGGDEVVLYLPEVGEAGAESLVRSIQAALREESIRYGRAVRVSGGVLVCTSPIANLNPLLSRAERLMYQAKDEGKDRFTLEVLDCADTVFS